MITRAQLGMAATALVGIGLVVACGSGGGGGGTPVDDGGAEGSTPTPEGGTPDGGGTDASAACPTPTGPTVHGMPLVQTETWTAVGSPHIVPGDLTVLGQLTIEPCAEVLIAPGKVITVDSAKGSLVANGTATQTIHIGSNEAGKKFGRLTSSRNGTFRLSYVTIDNGGAAGTNSGDPPAQSTGTITVGGQGSASSYDLLFFDHVNIVGSATNGIVLQKAASFAPSSTNLVIKGAGLYPMLVAVSGLEGLPTGGTYTGNGTDEIAIPSNELGSDTFRPKTTLHDLGVPYRVIKSGASVFAGALVVTGTTAPGTGVLTPATLTIEPGVKIRFEKGGALHISDVFDPAMVSPNLADATLVAVGTAAKPIVFTSAEASPAAGDWVGVSFAAIPSPTSVMSNVRVEYAGRASSAATASCLDIGATGDAAIRIHGAPATQFVTSTTILSSSSNGVDRSWRSNTPIDFTTGNTFTMVTACNQTYPPDGIGACPAPIPCPK